MKKLLTAFIATLTLISCFYDDSYNNDYSSAFYDCVEKTDFNKDISDKKHFHLSTAVDLTPLNLKDTCVVGDTLKFELKLSSIFNENKDETYNLYKSTDSDIYNYAIEIINNNTPHLNLIFLEEHPELKTLNLTEEEIRTNSIYKDLYYNSNSSYDVHAKYNTTNQLYESKVGIVLSSEGNKYLNISCGTRNLKATNNIYLNIPIKLNSNISSFYVKEK